MSPNNQLPPTPTGRPPRNLESKAYDPEASQFSNSASTSRKFPSMEENLNSTMTSSRRSRSFLTPKLAIALIFVGGFVLSVSFTCAVLAGIIEIQPSAIKGFFRSILGKS